MLKFNLTQTGKGLIDALQNNDKLAITHVRLWNNSNGQQVDLPVRSGAVVIDGTYNGPYVVVDVNDASDKNYQSDDVALLSGTSEVATLYKDANASGYEAVLTCSLQGRNAYPSIKYRTQTWASGKIPTSIAVMHGSGDECDFILSFGGKGGDPSDPSSQSATARITLGDNFPKTITFSNGDILETYDTVSAAGVKNGNDSYDASTEMGKNAIRPLYSKISIQKESNKQLKLRLSCQFDGAEKCKFNTTSINLPYASRFREGVVRFTDTSNPWISDGQRYNTVYSAADVDKKIAEINNNLGNLTDYAKKAEENTFTENNLFNKNVEVNGIITGNAVATLVMNAEEKDAMVVSLGYANNKYLSKTEASSTYLTQANASTTYLTQQDATATYLTKTEAGNTYLTQTVAANTYLTKTDANAAAANYAKLNADNDFAANTTNTFNGDVTVKGTFVVGKSQEAATFAVTHDGIISGTAIQIDKVSDLASDKLPTEGAVKSALNDVESSLQTKDNELQSQIDGINAGQNLADIVNNTTELAEYDVSHLKAKDDFQHGTSGTKWAIGDKVQVLGGGEVQSSVYELIKGPMPEGETNSIQSTNNTAYYWHYIGVYGTNAYTKSEIDTKVSEINNAISTKADKSDVNTELAKKANSADVYSKTEADGRFAQLTADNQFTGNNTFNGYIIGNAVTDDIANDITDQGAKLTTSAGVSSFVNTVVDTKISNLNLDKSYLKLNSTNEKQTVNSSVDFNGTIGGSAVAGVANATPDGSKLVTVDYVNYNCAQLASNNNFAGATNTFQAITATTVSANTFTGDGVTASQMDEGDITQNKGKIVSLGFAENRYVKQNAISDKDQVGAMGLFLYTGGDFKAMGTEVHGSLLHSVGMQLPMDGVVSWSQGAAVSTAEAETTWKLLNNTIAGEPCLVLAIRVG